MLIKLITPPGMLLTVALLVIYSANAFLIGSIEDSWPLLIGGGVAVVAAYGAAMLRPWSRYLVYGLTIGFLGKLGLSVYAGFTSGFFDFQFGNASVALGSLLPSLLMTLLSVTCCYMVHRYFQKVAPSSATRTAVEPVATIAPLLPRSLAGDVAWLFGTALALTAGHWLQSGVHLNHDVAWIGHSARWLLHGARFGHEILDVNPPMAWLISLPGAALANAGLVPEPLAIRLNFWAYVLISAVLLDRTLRRAGAESEPAATGWRIAFILVATLAAGASFGQREYASVVLAMPYLALAVVRWERRGEVGRFTTIAIGLMAGVAFAIKPYFLAVPFLVECLLISRIGWRRVLRSENIAIASVMVAYVLAVFTLMPDYLRITLPYAKSAYWAFDSGSLSVVVERFLAVAKPAAFGALIAAITRTWTSQHSVMLAALLGYSISYFVQAKGFVYHAFPVLMCASVFLGICLAAGIARTWLRFEAHEWLRWPALAALVLLVLVPFKSAHDDAARWYFYNSIASGRAGVFRQTVIETVNKYAPDNGMYFFALSTHPFPAFPTGSYANAEWSGRSPTQGVVAALARINEVKDPVLRRQIVASAELQRNMVIEDMTRNRPSIVFVDAGRLRLGMNGVKFDDLAFYAEDAQFGQIWRRYEEIRPIGNLRVFVRKIR